MEPQKKMSQIFKRLKQKKKGNLTSVTSYTGRQTATVNGEPSDMSYEHRRHSNGTLNVTVAVSTRLTPRELPNLDDDIEADSVLENEENNRRLMSDHLKYQECNKHPGHEEFVKVNSLDIHHLPPTYQNKAWVEFIKLKSKETVRIFVPWTSLDRPDDLGFAEYKGTDFPRTGSGTAFLFNMEKVEDCSCHEVPEPHKVSGTFKVMTAAHVVFDDKEAQKTEIEFFYDDENSVSEVVKATGVRVSYIDVKNNMSVVECRTHDLTLFQHLSDARRQREHLIQESLRSLVSYEPMVVLISHPHGFSKRISVGKLIDIKEEGDIKTSKDGVELIGCVLAYDTPTCPGTGGGSVNLIGKNEVCFAFAPHYASKSNGQNISGLGWTKYIKSLQLRGN